MEEQPSANRLDSVLHKDSNPPASGRNTNNRAPLPAAAPVQYKSEAVAGKQVGKNSPDMDNTDNKDSTEHPTTTGPAIPAQARHLPRSGSRDNIRDHAPIRRHSICRRAPLHRDLDRLLKQAKRLQRATARRQMLSK